MPPKVARTSKKEKKPKKASSTAPVKPSVDYHTIDVGEYGMCEVYTWESAIRGCGGCDKCYAAIAAGLYCIT